MHNPTHPGEFISEVYLRPNGISGRELAGKLGVAVSTLSRVLKSNSAVSPEMALRLSKAWAIVGKLAGHAVPLRLMARATARGLGTGGQSASDGGLTTEPRGGVISRHVSRGTPLETVKHIE
jgi:addiction module HigA family antidote